MTRDSRAHDAPPAQRGFAHWLARERALVALFDLGRRKGFALRAAQLYAFGVLVSYAIAMLLVSGEHRQGELAGLLYAALVSLSWVVGALAAFGTVRNLARSTDRAGLAALARTHGFSEREMLLARIVAAALRIARLIAIPALLLLLLALALGQSTSFVLSRIPAILAYAALLGVCLASLVELSEHVAPKHARALLTALVLAPLLLAQAYAWVPSLPSLFASLLDRWFDVGSSLT